jgi:hypothetical protein
MTANPSSPLVVAIDGPAGAGKSTVAARIAARFGLLNLESGAMYRAFALKAIQTDSDLDDREELGRLAERTRIRLLPAPLGNRVFLDDVEVTKRIREPDVTAAASRVSVHPAIRQWMVSMQRQLGASSGIVMEGRDIGIRRSDYRLHRSLARAGGGPGRSYRQRTPRRRRLTARRLGYSGCGLYRATAPRASRWRPAQDASGGLVSVREPAAATGAPAEREKTEGRVEQEETAPSPR